MKYHELDQAMQTCRNRKVIPANCLAPISKCALKKVQNKEEAFQDGDITGKTHHCLSSKTAGEFITEPVILLTINSLIHRNTSVTYTSSLILVPILHGPFSVQEACLHSDI